MRLLCAAALSLSFGLWLGFAEADEKSERATKLADRKKKFEAEYKDLEAQQKKAESPDAKNALAVEMRELVAITVGKVLTLAEDDPKDDAGFDALAFIINMSGKHKLTGEDTNKALALLIEHHVTNAKIKDILPATLHLEAAGEKLLQVVTLKATDKEVKAVAMLINGTKLARQADDEDDDEKKQAALAKAATDLLEKAAKEAPEAKTEGGTVAKLVAEQLDKLKLLTALAVGKVAPDVTAKLLDGKEIKLSSYKGKVVLLDVWATWCPPCVAMIPHERDLVKKLKGKPFELVSVSADKEKETLQKFLEKEEMPWTHWWDEGPKSKVLTTYRVRAFPTLYVIDHAGVIRHKWVGNPGNDKIDAAIEELVKAAEKAKG